MNSSLTLSQLQYVFVSFNPGVSLGSVCHRVWDLFAHTRVYLANYEEKGKIFLAWVLEGAADGGLR